MNTKQMKQAGEEHAREGKELTPNACQAIDAQIFAFIASETVDIADYFERMAAQSRIYKTMRGAFNRGWCAEHARITFAA